MEEHGNLGAWLEQSEKELCSLREGEADAQGLKHRLEEHKKVFIMIKCEIFNNYFWLSLSLKPIEVCVCFF